MNFLRQLGLLPLRAAALAAALVYCDVFVFGFAMSFFRCRELPLLRLLRKRIIFVFNGSDSRPAWMSGLYTLGPDAPCVDTVVRETCRQLGLLRRIEHYADEIVCHPLSAQLLRRPFVNHLQIGHPFASPDIEASQMRSRRPGPLRIVHAPTKPLQKGSAVFRHEIARLNVLGLEAEYQELTGRPNHEVLRAIADADLVLDELYSDIPFAGLGTESACLGTAVVVGGYGSRAIAAHLPASGIPRTHYVSPDRVPALIETMVRDDALRRRTAAENAAFVRDHWSPAVVAGKFLRVLTGDVPPGWRCHPSTITYWQGWGTPDERVLATCAAIVAQHGASALGIAHNPTLEREILSRL
jgi:glycosyltransferase involved in cell wall biosynthesis